MAQAKGGVPRSFLLSAWLAAAVSLLATPPAVPATGYQFLDDEAEGDFDIAALLTAPDKWPQGELRICFGYADEANHYYARLSQGKVSFIKVAGGDAKPIGTVGTLPPGAKDIAVVRRDWRMAFTAEGRLVAEAFDGELRGPKAGWWSSNEALKLEEPFIQPVDEIYVQDDFVRPPGESGDWRGLAGKWEGTSLQTGKANLQLSANPFAYAAHDPANSLASIGYWFWDEYRIEAAAKAEGPAHLGLACYVQDQDNFVLFRWAPTGGAEGGRERQLVQVSNGQWKPLASAPGGHVPGHWYRLALVCYHGTVQPFIDGQPALPAATTVYRHGAAGLYADQGKMAYYDDVAVTGSSGLADDFETDEGRWHIAHGHGAYREGKLKLYAPNGAARIVGGSYSWRSISLTTDLKSQDNGGIGLLFCYQDEDNYYAFRWGGSKRPAYRHKKQIVRVVDGQPEVIAQTFGAYKAGQVYPVRLTYEQGHIKVEAAGHTILEAADAALDHGAVGFFAEENKAAFFDNFSLATIRPDYRPPRITEQFTKEATMSGWASPAGIWDPKNGAYWNKTVFYGPSWARVILPEVGRHSGNVTLVVAGDGNDLKSGYSLTAQMEGGKREVILVLGRRQEQVAFAAATVPDGVEQPELVLRRWGQCVVGILEGRPVVAMLDDGRPLDGHYAAVSVQGLPVSLQTAYACGDHLLDYTFSGAPADWYASDGVWQVVDRWPCAPGWAWFGCKPHQRPVVFSKHSFEGDLTFEFYGAVVMDLPKEPGYSHPSDVNAVICSDGKRLDSGYSAIFGGWLGSGCGLLRRDQLIEQNSKFRFVNPVSTNFAFHRHWFYIRIEKQGNRIRQSIDGVEIADFEDPAPLSGGHVGFWSWDNGITIARARISYEKMGPLVDPSSLPSLGGEPDTTDVPFELYKQ
ncbi:MAG: hypothetical protein ACE5R4_11290 [Armatimonadota bacterium]